MDAPVETLSELLNPPGVELVEWRLDGFLQRHALEEVLEALSLLTSRTRLPVIATNRPARQRGAFEGEEATRIGVLRKAVEAGAEWVDLEEDVAEEELEWFRWGPAQVLLSFHDFSGTPDRSALQDRVLHMARRGAKVLKIATYAQASEDNLRVLELIPFARRELGIELIAFCMGPLGQWSRIVSLLLGSPWGYVQLPGLAPSAPGQLTPAGMRTALELCLAGSGFGGSET